MGNCLNSGFIEKEETRTPTERSSSKVLKQQRFHAVHVEDVLLKKTMDVHHVGKLEEGKKKTGKRVRFSDEVTEIKSKDEKNEVASESDEKGEMRVRVKLKKEEAALVISLLEGGGTRKPLEELIGELGSFVSSHKIKNTSTCSQEQYCKIP